MKEENYTVSWIGIVSSDSSSLALNKIVSDRVWQQLAELWLAMAVKDEAQLFTEDTLIKSSENKDKSSIWQYSSIERFFLLITPKFNALLLREQTTPAQLYQVSVIFDRAEIINRLIRLGNQQKWNIAVINYLQSNFIAKLASNSEITAEFMVSAIELLTNTINATCSVPTTIPHSTLPMEKLHYDRVERERIFEQLQIQISQNLNLSTIVQTAVDRSCSFLDLDRLLIYQLDVPLNFDLNSFKPVPMANTVTYEARRSDRTSSLLYFQQETCWQEFAECRNKYHQGFSLVIDDVDTGSHLNPCLKELMSKLEVRAKIVVPINIRGKLWGTIIAHQSEPRNWKHQEVQFLRQIAEHIEVAIFNHQSYQQLQQQKQLLEQQVKIQARQLKDALIAAEAASKSKHDFIGSMSHELRTPLTCVIGLSSTLLKWSSAKQQRSLPPEKQQQYLYLIEQSGKNLLTLIDNILEFSDVESGKHLLNIDRISLHETAEESLQPLQKSAATKNITLDSQINIESERDSFFADKVRLKEILFHLLSNAIEFTPEGGRVTLRIWREKHQVAFQVEDTGIGIAEIEIPLLFEKFKQIEDVRQRIHGGAGLGLALTKKLVELHGGTIEVESALESGSMFTVYLPEKAPSNPHLSPAIASQAALGSNTIVLITEDETSATFICQLLDTIEYQVVWLTSSEMAVKQITLLQPKIVIIDRDCAITDIKSIMNAIDCIPSDKAPRVALLCDVEHNKWKNTDCGIDGYLLKSMNPTQTLNRLNSLLELEHSKTECDREFPQGYEEIG